MAAFPVSFTAYPLAPAERCQEALTDLRLALTFRPAGAGGGVTTGKVVGLTLGAGTPVPVRPTA